jgi:L-ascorbate metabolism protein UlaG (beta-lactamase superfamily)
MRRQLKRTAAVLLLMMSVAAAWCAYQLHNHPSFAPYSTRMFAPAGDAPPGLRVMFLGGSTLLLDDGETAILTDGFFSRPNRFQVFAGRIAPDRERIAQSLAHAGIGRLAAVIVTHSHYTHAMDAPEVAKRTGALLIGSESTANIGRGWQLAADRMRVARDGDSFDFGQFHVTLIRTRHAPTAFTGGEIREPLVPPVRANQYLEGENYSLLIRHGTRSMLVQNSAGYIDGALRGRQADVVFLGIGTLGKQETVMRQAYWRETVHTVGARRVIPIQWDDYTLPLEQPLVPRPRAIDDFDVSMQFILERGRQDKVDVKFAPTWVRIDPFAGL